MVETVRDTTKEFLSMVKAKLTGLPKIYGFFVFGSFTREKQFNDIDIITILRGELPTNPKESIADPKGLIDLSYDDRVRYEYFLRLGTEQLKIPPIHNHGYFGIVQHRWWASNFNEKYELEQIKSQIRKFYEYWAGFNRLERSTRQEYGVDKPPRDFRISLEDSFWIGKGIRMGRDPHVSVYDTMCSEALYKFLEKINIEFEPEVGEYSKVV